MRRSLLCIMIAVALLLSANVHAKGPKKHRVYKGQTLGKIAKRYNITVDALCTANGISQKARIKPDMRLWVPPRDDEDGTRTAALRETRAVKPKAKNGPKARGKYRWHEVANKQRLGSIAKRYNVSLDAIRHANDIGPRSVIKPGQNLIVPALHDIDGSEARKIRLREEALGPEHDTTKQDKPTKGKHSWSRYIKKPKRRGWLKLVGRKGRLWEGKAVTRSGKATKAAKKAFKRVFATRGGKSHDIHPRLIGLVARVSDTFGGREIRLVSGFRLGATPKGSRHRQGRAIDFQVVGVPKDVVRDYVKTFKKVGIGHYPNSHFVHLDVREQWTYWVDYSKPGQPPQYGGFWTRRGKR
jgi:LysM repeat protein